jgi:hypothetical protein
MVFTATRLQPAGAALPAGDPGITAEYTIRRMNMKKGLSIILAVMLCLVFAGSAFAGEAPAEESYVNSTETISTEPGATLKKTAAAEEANKAGGSTPSTGELLRFIPITIDVESSKVVVSGYFINMSNNTVSNFTDFEMDAYMNGTLLVSGYFGNINKFTVYPGSTKYQTFTFTGSHGLNAGSYVCDDTFYCVTAFSFTVQ